MAFKYWTNLKAMVLQPTGGRGDSVTVTGSIAGFVVAPVAVGVGAAFLAASGGLIVPLAVGAGVLATAGAGALNFLGVLRASSGRRGEAMLYPYAAGYALGATVGWLGYSLLNPLKTCRDIIHGQKPNAPWPVFSAGAPSPASSVQDKDLTGAYNIAVTTPDFSPKTDAPAPKDSPKP